ncbi:MAG: trypsin-like peptidase domain-containing protein [Pseudomonas sp.]|uniref:trypsin-like peptidase domain-containing protein n=1 Tax=Pseudomonas sp. TaxID=306 RepID=UPI0032421277
MGEDVTLTALKSVVANVDSFSAFIGVDYRKIKYFYYIGKVSDNYKYFKIPKKAGGFRRICAPESKLMNLQSKIASILEIYYRPKISAHAFIKERSIVGNASRHVRRRFVFNVDLKDFFESITFPRVRGMLIAKPYEFSESVASVVAHLCTVDQVLPQGAPTSPIISNMICSRLDNQLLSLARKVGARYSRYADDITFSFSCPLGKLPSEVVVPVRSMGELTHHGAKVGSELERIISDNGFVVNQKKVRLQAFHQRQVVTGLIVNKKVNVDRRYVRKTRALIHSMEVYGIADATEKAKSIWGDDGPNLEAHVFGRALFIKQVQGSESAVYQSIAKRFNKLPSDYKLPLMVGTTEPESYSSRLGLDLINRCWVVEVQEGMSQGTGFFIRGGIFVTCAHVMLVDSGKPAEKYCQIHLVNNPSKKHYAGVVHVDEKRDIALLRVPSLKDVDVGYVQLEEDVLPEVGSTVSIWGFPNYKEGTRTVGRTFADIYNRFPMSGVDMCEVNVTLYSGNSGGPVLNRAEKLVGIAARGAVHDTQLNAFLCVSELVNVLADYEAIK